MTDWSVGWSSMAWEWLPAKPKRVPALLKPADKSLERIDYPTHLRGRVRFRRDVDLTCAYWCVYNTVTGQVVSSDNTGCGFEDAIRYCDKLVGAARIAWVCSMTPKQLTRDEHEAA